MPIPLPDLDDRRFSDLVDEGLRLIPGLAPSWTDHNPSDPGITLIELFAFVAEMLMYRSNRVSEANKRAFVKLLRGSKWELLEPVDEEIRKAVLDLRDEQRTVTAADFVMRAELVPGVARAYCLPNRNLQSGDVDAANRDEPAHVSVVVVAKDFSANLTMAVAAALAPNCLLTTRLHVVFPAYLDVRLNVTVHVFADRDEATLKKAILSRLLTYFDPVLGGADGNGWPLGRPVYVSEVLALLDAVDGVDFVTDVPGFMVLDAKLERGIWDKVSGAASTTVFVGLRLEANEFVKFLADGSNIDVQRQPVLGGHE